MQGRAGHSNILPSLALHTSTCRFHACFYEPLSLPTVILSNPPSGPFFTFGPQFFALAQAVLNSFVCLLRSVIPLALQPLSGTCYSIETWSRLNIFTATSFSRHCFYRISHLLLMHSLLFISPVNV